MKNIASVTLSFVACMAFSVECQAGSYFENLQKINATLQQQSAQPQQVQQKISYKKKGINRTLAFMTQKTEASEYAVPQFSGLGEEKKWKEDNQKDVDHLYEELTKEEAEWGKELFLTAEDTPETVDKKYKNAQAVFDVFWEKGDQIATRFDNLYERCKEQGCYFSSMEAVKHSMFEIQILEGTIKQIGWYANGATYVGKSGCTVTEKVYDYHEDQMKELLAKSQASSDALFGDSCVIGSLGALKKTTSYGCATIKEIMQGKGNKQDVYNNYLEYLKSAYENIGGCKDAIVRQIEIDQKYELDKAIYLAKAKIKEEKNAKASEKRSKQSAIENEQFRKNLKVGDLTFFGEVIAIKGNDIKVRGQECTFKINGTCARKEMVDSWYPRSMIMKPFNLFLR